MSSRWSTVEELFHEALERADASIPPPVTRVDLVQNRFTELQRERPTGP